MKKIILLSLLFAFVAVGFNACKYEEGPGISLRSKTARISGEWILDDVTANGTSIYKEYTLDGTVEFKLNIKDDNTLILSAAGSQITGEWKFNDDKTELMMKIEGDSDYDYFKIIQLKNESFIYEEIESASNEPLERFFFVQ